MDLEERIMLAVVRVSENFKKKNSALFKHNLLTFSQYNVLRILDSAESGSMSLSEISGQMLVSGANMTGIAKRLEKTGFIIRERQAADERVKLLSLLPAGRAVLQEIQGKKNRNNHQYFNDFSNEKKTEFLDNLITMLKSVSLKAE